VVEREVENFEGCKHDNRHTETSSVCEENFGMSERGHEDARDSAQVPGPRR